MLPVKFAINIYIYTSAEGKESIFTTDAHVRTQTCERCGPDALAARYAEYCGRTKTVECYRCRRVAMNKEACGVLEVFACVRATDSDNIYIMSVCWGESNKLLALHTSVRVGVCAR